MIELYPNIIGRLSFQKKNFIKHVVQKLSLCQNFMSIELRLSEERINRVNKRKKMINFFNVIIINYCKNN